MMEKHILRKFKLDAKTAAHTPDARVGEWVVCIPDEDWICPGCGCGNEGGDGLYSDDDRESVGDIDSLIFYYDELLLCSKCEWEGAAGTLYNLAMKAKDMVQCPCCKGDGSVRSKKAAEYKKLKKRKS